MNTLELLNISTELATPEQVILTMPVTDYTKQPFGILHGGISAVLAETAASIGGNKVWQTTNQVAVGVDLNIHHLNSVSHGILKAVATPLHIGHRLQTWQVSITEQNSAMTIAFATITLTSHRLKEGE